MKFLLTLLVLISPAAFAQNLGSTTSTGAQAIFDAGSLTVPFAVQVTGVMSSSTGTAIVDIEVSNDKQNFIVACTITLSLTTAYTSDGCGILIPWRYVRMNPTTLTSNGTVKGYISAR